MSFNSQEISVNFNKSLIIKTLGAWESTWSSVRAGNFQNQETASLSLVLIRLRLQNTCPITGKKYARQ